MKHDYRAPVPFLLLLIVALFARSAAQDDLIPMPTAESTADPVLTPEISIQLLSPSNGSIFSEIEDFQFDWLPLPEANNYQLKLERDGVFYGQIDFSSGSICSPTICEVYPPLFDLPPLEAEYTYTWSITAQTPQGSIESLKQTFTIIYFVADFAVSTDEWSDPAAINPTWILYADSFGLSILDPNLPNTDPLFDRRILVSNGSNVAGDFGLITHPVWKPETRTLAFVGATSYRNGGGELVFYPKNIWTMRASGQQLQQLTFTPESEQHLAWSPDGTKIAFSTYNSASNASQVHVIDANTGFPVISPIPNADFPQWHRQSQRLAYVSSNRIMRYDFTDGSTVQIAAPITEGYSYLDWYVGGGRNEFVYHNIHGIWKYDAVTATHTQLTFNWHNNSNQSGTYIDQFPDWSPTGQRILLERRYLNSYITLGVILPDGTRFRPLTRANSITPYIQARGHVDWANNFSPIINPTVTPTPSRTPSATPTPTLCPPIGPRVPACEAATATPTLRPPLDPSIELCEATLGQGARRNGQGLLIPIFSAPHETHLNATSVGNTIAQIVFPDGGANGYSGADETIIINVTGKYSIIPTGSNPSSWYRVSFHQDRTGWITPNDMQIIRTDARDFKGCALDLREQDRDGEGVYIYVYSANKPTARLYHAPIRGNIYTNDFTGNNIRYVRVRASATNPAILGGGDFIQIQRWDQENAPKIGWVFNLDPDHEESEVVSTTQLTEIQDTVPDRTAEFGGPFQAAYTAGTLPAWSMPPRFTFYPISIASACASVNQTIDGIGVPFNPALYGSPGYHTGVDFFAPDGSSVYSIANHGLVVGIGVGKTTLVNGNIRIVGVPFSSHEWGSAGVELDVIGYSIIIRYGHLYVLYGHLREIDPTIFVGAQIQAGSRLGIIGSFNDPHVHIEVRNFDAPIPPTGLQSPPMRQFGFTSFASVGDDRANYHYDLTQFFNAVDVVAWANETQQSKNTVTGLGISLTDGDAINLGISCSRIYRHHPTIPTVNDPVLGGNIRGFEQSDTSNFPPIPPSQAPTQP